MLSSVKFLVVPFSLLLPSKITLSTPFNLNTALTVLLLLLIVLLEAAIVTVLPVLGLKVTLYKSLPV
ncbi:hypothetical protein D3C85_1810610 [compost metagenome]